MLRWLKQATARAAAARQAQDLAAATAAQDQLLAQAQQVQRDRQAQLLALVLVAANRAQLRAVKQEAVRLLLEPQAVMLALAGRKAQLVQERLARARSGRSLRSSTSRRKTARPTSRRAGRR